MNAQSAPPADDALADSLALIDATAARLIGGDSALAARYARLFNMELVNLRAETQDDAERSVPGGILEAKWFALRALYFGEGRRITWASLPLPPRSPPTDDAALLARAVETAHALPFASLPLALALSMDDQPVAAYWLAHTGFTPWDVRADVPAEEIESEQRQLVERLLEGGVIQMDPAQHDRLVMLVPRLRERLGERTGRGQDGPPLALLTRHYRPRKNT